MWIYLELLFAVVHLHVQAMRSVPVPVDNVCLAVTVEVSQSNPSSMLYGIFHTCSYMVMCSIIRECLPCVLHLIHIICWELTDLQDCDLLNCSRSSHQPAVPHQWRFHLRCSWTGSLVHTRCHKTHRTGFDWQWAQPQHLALLHSWRQRDDAWR